MNHENNVVQFTSTQQYCTLLDKALTNVAPIITNGWLLANEAEKIIRDKNLFYCIGEGSISLLTNNEYDFSLQYIAYKNAFLSIPNMELPVVCNLRRVDGVDDSASDELLKRDGFLLKRINVGMDLMLINRIPLGDELKEFTIEYALEQDWEKISQLLYRSFDPILDNLPNNRQLIEFINHGHVLVVKNKSLVIATLIRKPKGTSVIYSWIATDPEYKRFGLSWNLQDKMERICEDQGYKRSTVWINASNEKWIQRTQKRGYRLNHQYIYSYLLL